MEKAGGESSENIRDQPNFGLPAPPCPDPSPRIRFYRHRDFRPTVNTADVSDNFIEEFKKSGQRQWSLRSEKADSLTLSTFSYFARNWTGGGKQRNLATWLDENSERERERERDICDRKGCGEEEENFD